MEIVMMYSYPISKGKNKSYHIESEFREELMRILEEQII
jgi:hypothetical protein